MKYELSAGPLRVDLLKRHVFLKGNIVSFTLEEYHQLVYLMLCSPLSHEAILKEIWCIPPNAPSLSSHAAA